ncbi:hypothetical protein E0H22_06030 [Rhodopseudomonas boonkerdii]|uniref:hypothetical protein n=1 Tax=Rhodopseudomonas boonkerdii TaxID=475937 RepID=UPI001E5DCDFC|nr:hypothetical protein [Rhodopseudomonas boonkerdii]UGV25273.1 hypothetical protein E0H22_06030 [Rhodopseudomonas boonkerdii]
MTSVNTGLNPYTNYGSAYARAAATQPSLANALNANESASSSSSAATNLTLSEAARAQLASSSDAKSIAAVIADSRTALDGLYAAAKVKGPYDASGKPTVDLASLDRRALFAISTNNGGKFTSDEQKAASAELTQRFNAAMAPAAGTAKLTGNFAGLYKAAADYLDAAGPEEKATALWAAQRDAVAKGVQATQRTPDKAPLGIANDPVAAYLAQPDTAQPVKSIGDVAKAVRAVLDAQAKAAKDSGKGELVFDAGRKTGQMADLSGIDNRSLSAMSLNQDGLFSKEESFAAKQTLDARNRAAILEALQASQKSGDPSQLSLGILNVYSGMSAEERLASNWTPAFRDNAVAAYKSTNNILSMLKGG